MAIKPEWEGKGYSFFQNTNCEYFPCHQTNKTEDFNCLFCYCPLYALGERCGGGLQYTESGIKDCSALGDKCGGNFQYLASGYKDCSGCLIPHRRENYGRILEKYPQIADLAKQNRTKDEEK